jgi:hypothetical protein
MGLSYMNKKNIDTYSLSDLEKKIKKDIFNISSNRGGIYLRKDYGRLELEITPSRISYKIREVETFLGIPITHMERTSRSTIFIFDNLRED